MELTGTPVHPYYQVLGAKTASRSTLPLFNKRIPRIRCLKNRRVARESVESKVVAYRLEIVQPIQIMIEGNAAYSA